MSRHGQPRRGTGADLALDLAFAAAFFGAGLLGRATIVDGQTLSVIWPAAGVAVLWFLTRSTWIGWGRSAVLLAIATLALNAFTGASLAMCVVFVVANLVQVTLTVVCLHRFIPSLWGIAGQATFESTRKVGALIGAALLGSLAGAVAGMLGLYVVSGTWQLDTFLLWWGRNFTGVLAVVSTGHLVAHYLARRESGSLAAVSPPSAEPPPHAGNAEVAALGVVTAAAYALVFTQDGLPLAFPLSLISVWAGLRLPTPRVAVHSAVCGIIAVVLSTLGNGPFGSLEHVEHRAALTQLFVATVVATGLFLATSRDERSALVTQLQGAQLEAASSAELWLAVVESMSDGLMVLDADGDVLTSNAAARVHVRDFAIRGSGQDRRTRLHRADGTPLPWRDHPAQRALSEVHVPSHDVVVINPDHTHRVLSVTATALDEVDPTGSTSYVVVVYRDVTDERERGNQLAGFAGVVAHDLRTPLTGCRGWIDWARTALQDQSEEARAAVGPHLERARASTLRMDSLIEDLLSQATSEGQGLDLETIDLPEVLEEAAALHGAEVEVGALPRVRADRTMLQQLFGNLVGNAVKYVAPDVSPRVEVFGEERAGVAVVCLRDNGIGIPEQHHAAVFEKFHRAHAEDSRYTGTGLGLAICRTIVERHGGSIRVAAGAPGEGTTFEITLPAAS